MKASQCTVEKPKNRALPKPDCVVKVGGGRGFVFEYCVAIPNCIRQEVREQRPRNFISNRVVLTAAHCLGQKMPPPHAMAFRSERTYKKLLRTLDGTKKGICAECLFLDPVSDIAVLGCPDEQEMEQEAKAYQEVIDNATPLCIGQPLTGSGWVLALEGHWIPTRIEVFEDLRGMSLAIGPTKPGMSGSPILNDAGRAVGIVVLGGEVINSKGKRADTELNGGQPTLACNLSGWLIGKPK